MKPLGWIDKGAIFEQQIVLHEEISFDRLVGLHTTHKVWRFPKLWQRLPVCRNIMGVALIWQIGVRNK
jgi:hypothetical protein